METKTKNELITEAVDYITTKEDCQKVIDELKTVCSQCGGKLSPIETVDNANRPTFWSGCLECQRFDHSGVKPLIYEIAKELVTKRYYRAYHHEQEPDLKNKERHDYWLKSQIGGVSRQVQEIIYLYQSRGGGN